MTLDPSDPTSRQAEGKLQPRTKLEVLFRDMLDECHGITQTNAQTATQLAELQKLTTSLPKTIQDASSTIANLVAAQAGRDLYNASRSAASIHRDLVALAKKLVSYHHTTSWMAIGLGLLCGVIGGAIGGLAVVLAIKF